MNKRTAIHIGCYLTFVSGSSFALTLLEAYEAALKNDPKWSASREAFFADQEIKNQTLARLLPQIHLNFKTEQKTTNSEAQTDSALDLLDNASIGDVSFCLANTDGFDFDVAQPFLDCLATQSPIERRSSFSSSALQLNLVQPLFRLDRLYEHQQGRLESNIGRVNLEIERQELLFRITQSYFKALQAEREEQLALKELALSSTQLDRIQRGFERGEIKSTDVYAARARVDLAQALWLSSQNEFTNAKEDLENITRLPATTLEQLPENIPIDPPIPSEVTAWINTAKSKSPQILRAQLNKSAAEKDLLAKKAAHSPKIDLAANHTRNDSSNARSSFTQGVNSTSAIALQLDMPIFTGGGNVSRERQSRHRLAQSEYQSQDTEEKTINHVKQLFRQVNALVIEHKARQTALISARKSSTASERAYERGVNSITDVTLAQKDEFQAESDWINSQFQYILTTLELKKAAGILDQSDIESLSSWLSLGEKVSDTGLKKPASPAFEILDKPADPIQGLDTKIPANNMIEWLRQIFKK
jgi:outer membrane protein